MRILVGLGNPGTRYKGTRHNVGFEAIDKLCFDYGIRIRMHRRFRAEIGEGRIHGVPVLTVAPQTYMNVSGEAVQAVLHYYKLPPSGLIAVYDDVSLPLGDIRVRAQGGAGGQKGMASLIACLGTDAFPRVRIGIGPKPPEWELSDYVLSRFMREEWDGFIKGVTLAADAAACILKEGTANAMNIYNKRLTPPGEGGQ